MSKYCVKIREANLSFRVHSPVSLLQCGRNRDVIHVGKGLLLLVSDVTDLFIAFAKSLPYLRLIRDGNLGARLRGGARLVKHRQEAVEWLNRGLRILQRAGWPSWTYWGANKWPGHSVNPLRVAYNKERIDVLIGGFTNSRKLYVWNQMCGNTIVSFQVLLFGMFTNISSRLLVLSNRDIPSLAIPSTVLGLKSSFVNE